MKNRKFHLELLTRSGKKVSFPVAKSKLKNKKFYFELLTQSSKNEKYHFQLLTQSRKSTRILLSGYILLVPETFNSKVLIMLLVITYNTWHVVRL